MKKVLGYSLEVAGFLALVGYFMNRPEGEDYFYDWSVLLVTIICLFIGSYLILSSRKSKKGPFVVGFGDQDDLGISKQFKRFSSWDDALAFAKEEAAKAGGEIMITDKGDVNTDWGTPVSQGYFVDQNGKVRSVY